MVPRTRNAVELFSLGIHNSERAEVCTSWNATAQFTRTQTEIKNGKWIFLKVLKILLSSSTQKAEFVYRTFLACFPDATILAQLI